MVFAGYFIWNASHSLPVNTEQFNAITNNQEVEFINADSYYVVQPKTTPRAGLIIYPGAFAEPRAYVGQYGQLAQNGIAVFVIRSPFNFALLDINRATRIINDNPTINNWYVAGHSLGGVTACQYAKNNQEKLSGLILLASYCNGDAQNLTLPVLSISASKDGLATTEKINNNKSGLPPNTKYVVIDGANHTQFGSFAKTQGGDGQATIQEQSAREQILSAIKAFIQ